MEELLRELVAAAGLPEVREFAPINGHGFDHTIVLATLADGRRVVLRHRHSQPRPLPVRLARFLEDHDVPAPRLLGGNEEATLYEYAPGETLSALAGAGRMTDELWRSVGTAFRRLHAVRFPAMLEGVFVHDDLVLSPTDPVQDLHGDLTADEPYLASNLPELVPHLARLHEEIDEFADRLREPTVLLHANVSPSNVIVGPDETLLIDWGHPRVGNPAAEIAALEEHIYLIDRSERLPDAFYQAYGPRQPSVALYRLIDAIGRYGDFEEGESPDPALQDRAVGRHIALATYLSTIGERLDDLRP
jgi:aminoglycoside phosphotransferase (APT) family kinase protein